MIDEHSEQSEFCHFSHKRKANSRNLWRRQDYIFDYVQRVYNESFFGANLNAIKSDAICHFF